MEAGAVGRAVLSVCGSPTRPRRYRQAKQAALPGEFGRVNIHWGRAGKRRGEGGAGGGLVIPPFLRRHPYSPPQHYRGQPMEAASERKAGAASAAGERGRLVGVAARTALLVRAAGDLPDAAGYHHACSRC